MYYDVQAGDLVIRDMHAGKVELRVDSTDERFIYCGGRKFRKDNGYEVAPELGPDGLVSRICAAKRERTMTQRLRELVGDIEVVELDDVVEELFKRK